MKLTLHWIGSNYLPWSWWGGFLSHMLEMVTGLCAPPPQMSSAPSLAELMDSASSHLRDESSLV